MTNPESIHIIPCIKTYGGLGCGYSFVCDPRVSDNEIWCSKWRQNRSKDGVFRACEGEYKMGEEKPL